MQLQRGEQVIRIYHHHPLPFVIQILKSLGASFPFFFLLFLFSSAMRYEWIVISVLFIMAIYTVIIVYLALIYWLDKLVITNKRIIHIDWKLLSQRDEGEALLTDIQDISSKEKGILSALYLFDYGQIRLETAASKATIIFTEAPDPEGIKAFLTMHIDGCRPDAACGTVPAPSPIVE